MSDPSQRPMGRRTFLGIAGAAGVVAGCSPKAATQKLVPYVVPPLDIVPGTPLWYRSSCRECPAGCGVTAKTREGRAVKLEGNPEDPIGRGALCARGQAALQALYHPQRFRGPLRRGKDGALAPVSWDEAEQALVDAMAAAHAKGPGRVRMVTRLEPGGLGVVQKTFLRALAARDGDRVVLDPFEPAPLRAASEALFGRAELPVFDLATARTVVAFGADFLETWTSPVEHARQLASGRGRIGAARTRLTWVGPRLALTGASADRWIRARAGGELAVALGVLRFLVDPRSGVTGLAPEAAAIRAPLEKMDPADLVARAGVRWSEIEALGRELADRRPSALLGPGTASQGPDATRLAAALLLANLVLGNMAKTVLYGLDPKEDAPSPGPDVEALLAAMAAGEVDVLLVQHADLVGSLPASLRAADALARVPLVASFALRPDPTTDRAHLVLPDHHTLESFGDVVPRRGFLNLVQPVMTPLADTRAAGQVLLEVAAKLPPELPRLPWTDFHDYLAQRVAGTAATGAPAGKEEAPPAKPGKPAEQPAPAPDAAAAFRDALQRGGRWTPATPETPRLAPGGANAFLTLPPLPAAGSGELDLVLFPTALRSGGDLPWLREIPDALSSVSWTPWLEIAPATAAQLGVATGDAMIVSTRAGTVEVPAYVFPGIRDDAVGLPLGGREAPAILPWAKEAGSGAPAFAGVRATVRAARRRTRLPLLEGSPYQHGREIVPTVSAAAPAVRRPDLSKKMYPEPPHPEHRWAMAIDLDRCTGCQACVVACFAENNVPVMGPEAADEGRYMGWIRVERYLGEEPGGALDVRLLLMLCQHCTNAPCEPVCPVYATYHTPEGLNAQIYNRCVGTRYCSNNCPYKVRTFNWRDAQFPRPLEMQLNPDVTVRSRGVMEKCTFCVQRIRYAENQAKTEGRPVADGEIVPACAQTCPAQAIVFGDAKNPSSRVSRLSRDPRGFGVLEALNTQPAITYLAPVRDREGA